MSTIKHSGTIAILWGTTSGAAGADADTAPSGMLIESLSFTPKNSEPIDIEDGDGLSAVQVHPGYDGGAYRATAVYDSTKKLPVPGAAATITMPKTDGTAGTVAVACYFWSWSFTRSRKKEAMIEMNFTHRPNINV